jgi:stage V sporulation protein G
VEITEVRIKLVEEKDNNERLHAFCSVTFDNAFVVRDLKIIDGAKGYFVAMPSRKLTDRCPSCSSKNHLRSRFCSFCGYRLDENRAIRQSDGRAKLHADIAHPINSACREAIQEVIIRSFHEEQEKAKLPGYVCTYDDVDFDDYRGHHGPNYRTDHAQRGGPRHRPSVMPEESVMTEFK